MAIEYYRVLRNTVHISASSSIEDDVSEKTVQICYRVKIQHKNVFPLLMKC